MASAGTTQTTQAERGLFRPGRGDGGYLSKRELRYLAAIAEAVLPEQMSVPPNEVAENVDRYMADFRAQRKWIVKVAAWGLNLYPLVHFKGTLSRMPLDQRRAFIRAKFIDAIDKRKVLPFVRRPLRAGIRFGQQMSFLGYYGDPRAFPETGYVPFSQRPRYAKAVEHLELPVPQRVETMPHDEVPSTMTADVVVIGSGAGGAIMAHRLAEAGRSVLVLERGRHIEPKDFSEDEIKQITTLYADGALQQSRDFDFQVLQGSCVGGTTVVNNAVCFNIPDHVRDTWNREHGTNLDPARLTQSFDTIREWLRITRQPESVVYPGAFRFVEGVKKLGLDKPPYESEIVDANVAGCPGSGYCNIGCAFGSKLSMLDTVLPQGQRAFGDRFRILASCTATKLHDSEDGAEVEAELWGGRKIRIRAQTVVVAAGTIASSWLLMQSGMGGGRAGRNLSFNMGSPITADFEEPQHSYDGLQITHYVRPPESDGYMLETWFNPVVSQALNMPGWFEDHARNMKRYDHLAAAGALIGTKPTGKIRRAITGGPDLDFRPDAEDMKRLIGALKVTAQIYLEADATRVMPSTFRTHEWTKVSELSQLDTYVKDASDLNVGTGHPQGGNAMGDDPATSAVGPDFRVRGTKHVFACDASIFPTAVTVNPQLTVMALADYAAPSVLKG